MAIKLNAKFVIAIDLCLTARKKPICMNKVDFKLSELLLKDGRMTFKELARKVGMDEWLASRRVKRIQKDSIISGLTAT